MRAMEAADVSKEESIVVMPTTIPDPSEVGGVKVEPKPCKGNQPRNVGIVATKATRRTSVGRSWPTRSRTDPDPGGPNEQIGNGRTTSKDPKNSERGQPS